jgi:hypothetical protein
MYHFSGYIIDWLHQEESADSWDLFLPAKLALFSFVLHAYLPVYSKTKTVLFYYP